MPYKNLPESEWSKMDRCVEQVMGKQPDLDKQAAIAICYTSIEGKEYKPALSIEPIGAQYRVFDTNSGETLKQVNTAREAAEWQAQYKSTVKADYDWDKCIKDQLEEYGDEETAKKVCGSIRAKFGEYSGKAIGAKERSDIEAELGITRNVGIVDRLLSWFKEGRRNSNTDAGRLQTIHDLAVENGAQCPMIYKQVNGKSRWVLLSTNSYMDRDGEIISQKAQEADVERMNETKQFGPLRLWHMGYPDVVTKEAGPGVDVGDCDYAQMFGRVRVESGTFRDERIAAAIKGRADQWAGSIGFLHPLDQPDRNGVYTDSYTFERSLLPRGKASNYLTPLAAIVKENEMTTTKEKIDQLTSLLGDAALADAVLKQAETTEKAALERGLKFKQEAPPVEGSPEEEKKEPPAEAAAEESEGEKPVDYAAMAKGLEPFISKMIETKMSEATKEIATKEAGIQSSLDELTKQVKELISDQPRSFFNGFRPSQSGATLLKDANGAPVTLKDAPQGDPLDSVIDQLMKGAQNQFMQPTPPQAAPPVVP